MVEPERPHAIRRTRVVWWISKATRAEANARAPAPTPTHAHTRTEIDNSYRSSTAIMVSLTRLNIVIHTLRVLLSPALRADVMRKVVI